MVIRIKKSSQSTFQKDGKSHNALIEDFNTFMYNQILHHDKKYFSRYCFQSFTTAK